MNMKKIFLILVGFVISITLFAESVNPEQEKKSLRTSIYK